MIPFVSQTGVSTYLGLVPLGQRDYDCHAQLAPYGSKGHSQRNTSPGVDHTQTGWWHGRYDTAR